MALQRWLDVGRMSMTLAPLNADVGCVISNPVNKPLWPKINTILGQRLTCRTLLGMGT